MTYDEARAEAIREINDIPQGAAAEAVYDAIERAVLLRLAETAENMDRHRIAGAARVASRGEF